MDFYFARQYHIQTHVPLVRNDVLDFQPFAFIQLFKPTFLLRGTTMCIPVFTTISPLQTHVPLARNDRMIMEYLSDGKIQTNVPLVRNDSSILQNPFPLIHSNPRSSCEERPSASLQHDSAIYNSNPRPSCAERRFRFPTVRLYTTIQTNVPLARNDFQNYFKFSISLTFKPTSLL